MLWEASDRVCGKRLRPLLPVLVDAMERHGHLRLASEVRAGLLSISATTIDRALHEVREPEEDESAVTRHHQPRSGATFRCGPLTVGTIRRLGSWRRILWPTAARRRKVVSCKP